MPGTFGIAGGDAVFETAEHRFDRILACPVGDREVAFPRFALAGAQDERGLVGDLARHGGEEAEAFAFLDDPVATLDREPGFGRVFEREPRGEDAAESRRKERAVDDREDRERQHRDQGEHARPAQPAVGNGFLRAQRFGRVLGDAARLFTHRFGATGGRAGFCELDGCHQQALQSAVVLFDLQCGARGVERAELAPAGAPSPVKRNAEQRPKEQDAPCNRQVQQPIGRHANQEQPQPPAAEGQQATRLVQHLLTTPHRLEACRENFVYRGIGHGRSYFLLRIHSKPTKPASSQMISPRSHSGCWVRIVTACGSRLSREGSF